MIISFLLIGIENMITAQESFNSIILDSFIGKNMSLKDGFVTIVKIMFCILFIF